PPDGVSAIAAFQVRSMAKLEAAPIEDDPAGGPARADRIARSVMLERLGVHLDLFEAGEHFRDLNNIASPLQNIPQVFDQMPRSTEEEWSNIAARLQLVPQAIAGYRRTLTEGDRARSMRRGAVPAPLAPISRRHPRSSGYVPMGLGRAASSRRRNGSDCRAHFPRCNCRRRKAVAGDRPGTRRRRSRSLPGMAAAAAR